MSNNRKSDDVPNTASGIQIAMILLGILITPVLLASSSLGSQLELGNAALIIASGSLILTVLAAINISIGEKARLPTYGIVKFSFGNQGAIAINIIMAISLFGWITVTANMFGHSVYNILSDFGVSIPIPILVAVGCVIFVTSTAFGFEMLGKVSKVAVPVIIVLMFVVLFLTTNSGVSATEKLAQLPFGTAVSSVVGTIIVLVTTAPDFGSFVHNRKHAVMAGVLTFGLVYPVLFFVGVVPSALTSEGSLLGAMAVIGTTLPAAVLLVFACVTGNAGNMFQGTLVVSTLFNKIAKWKITVVLGILATVLGSMEIMSWFIPFLLFLGIATPPIAGIYIADFFMNRQEGYDQALLEKESAIKPKTFVAWGLGSLVGFATVNGMFTLTSISSLDSILIAFLGYFLLCRRSSAPMTANNKSR
ncbi:cytosine permease [Vibrio metschnikovii]|uniref:cytosine permease n=1 Tax=Vibrio metschnikovii TaxID=28172 RepID=UPI001C2FDE91|nr:cytosine permease [Vibrio metschnikovii]EKO3674163.1 cytosine permease [Vibrio metschnikovii]EKO3895471.1 cytosine permease [Vibrio metschnikovii]EKO3925782.1 cytosine permease [Vibrio metschnikovii]MDM7486593.1 cytosine permease [Vibrio metschnikovii]